MQTSTAKQDVLRWFKEHRPDMSVNDTGQKELLINGKRLDLENLIRMCNHEPGRAQNIIEHYLAQLFEGDAKDISEIYSDWEEAEDHIFPRLQPDSIFQHLSRALVAHEEFVQNTSVVFVADLPQMTISLTMENAEGWYKDCEQLREAAIRNLVNLSLEPDIQFAESRDGGYTAQINLHDGYDAARLLLPDLHERLAPKLGADFYVGIPARDVFVAFTRISAPFVRRIQKRMRHDFERLPYPITPELFLVTQDGISPAPEEVIQTGFTQALPRSPVNRPAPTPPIPATPENNPVQSFEGLSEAELRQLVDAELAKISASRARLDQLQKMIDLAQKQRGK